MGTEQTTLRDWHRLFGLLLTDFFTDSPFIVEVERDLSVHERFQEEGIAMYTMADFTRDYFKERLLKLTPEEREEILRALPLKERLAALPLEDRLAGLSAEEIRKHLEQLTAGRKTPARKPRRKK